MSDKLPLTIPVPMPVDWSRLHALLAKASQARGKEGVHLPPVPLILAGAAFSRPSAIRQRWIDLLHWANEHGFADLVRENLPAPPDVDVADQIAGVSEEG